tara:strand:- start:354 stop:1121 length:768 start_codon:yes stop_codon:yes gene_type:complete
MSKANDRKIKITDCFVIHLDRATERKKQVEFLKKNIPLTVSVISAIDGDVLDSEEQDIYINNIFRPKYPFKMRSAEIATFLSHRMCWKKILDDRLDAALIIEDDVNIDINVFYTNLKKALEEIKPGDFLRLPISKREKHKVSLRQKKQKTIFKPTLIGLGMQGQIVTKRAAKELLNATQRIDRPVDSYLQLWWLHKVNILTFISSGISENSNKLGGTLIGRKKDLLNIIFREIMRPIYRFKIYNMSVIYSVKTKK